MSQSMRTRVKNTAAIAGELRKVARSAPTENALDLVWSLTKANLANAMSSDAAIIPYPRLASALEHTSNEIITAVDPLPHDG